MLYSTPVPPSEHHTCPEAYEQVSEANNTYSGAISTGWPGLPGAYLPRTSELWTAAGRRWTEEASSMDWRDGIHPNATRSQLLGQRLGKGYVTGFGLRIVHRDRARFKRLNGSGVNDHGAFLQMA